MMAMGLDHLVQWVDKGEIPPRADRVMVDKGAIVTDQFGNAKGGVRNTYVDAPVAQYGVPNAATGSRANVQINGQQAASFYCSIAGFEIPMKTQDLAVRYLNAAGYRKQVSKSLKELTKEGWFLPLYSKQVESDATLVKFQPSSPPLSEHRPN
jgi:hypothetical protein